MPKKTSLEKNLSQKNSQKNSAEKPVPKKTSLEKPYPQKNSQKILNQKTRTQKNSPKKPTSRKMKVDLRLLFSLIQDLRNIVLKMRFEIQKVKAEISGIDMF